MSADEALNDLLLPLVKGYGSEKSYTLIGQESLQCFGGSGYLQDYPLEQYVRDAKIDTLYEGTTAIQGQDLFFRKIVRDQGRALTRLMTEVAEFAKGDAGNGSWPGSATCSAPRSRTSRRSSAPWSDSSRRRRWTYATSTRWASTRPGCSSRSATCRRAWLLLRQAEVALAAINGGASGREGAFYEGKVAAARWYARQVLPLLAAERLLAESTDNDVMDLPEDSF